MALKKRNLIWLVLFLLVVIIISAAFLFQRNDPVIYIENRELTRGEALWLDFLDKTEKGETASCIFSMKAGKVEYRVHLYYNQEDGYHYRDTQGKQATYPYLCDVSGHGPNSSVETRIIALTDKKTASVEQLMLGLASSSSYDSIDCYIIASLDVE